MGSNRFLVLVTAVASLGGLLFGFDIAIITGAVPFIKSHFQLNDIELGWGVSSLLVGCVLGAIMAGYTTEKLGRKKTLFGVAFLFAITCIGTGISTSFDFFIMNRLLGGIAVGGASMASPMYISEIAPYKIRGRLVSFYQLSIVVGIVVSYGVNYFLHDIGENNWRWMFISGAFPSSLFFFLLFFVPESPRYLLRQGAIVKAVKVLRQVGGEHNAKEELEKLAQVSAHAKSKPNFKVLLSPSNRKVVLVGLGLAIFVQLCGINTIIDYAPIIFQKAGWSIDVALFSTFVMGFVNLGCTFISIWLIERVGRRALYLSGSVGMTLILTFIVLLSALDQFQGLIAIGLILGFVGIFAACIGPVFWTLVSEIFPNNIRSLAMTIPVFTQWVFNAIVVGLFPWVLAETGVSVTFSILAFSSASMLLFTYFFIPETKGKTLEEIEELWSIPKK